MNESHLGLIFCPWELVLIDYYRRRQLFSGVAREYYGGRSFDGHGADIYMCVCVCVCVIFSTSRMHYGFRWFVVLVVWLVS